MSKRHNLLAAVIILAALIAVLPGCGEKPEPTPIPAPLPAPAPTPQLSPAAQSLTDTIAGIEITQPTALANLLGVSQGIEAAQEQGIVSQAEGEQLEENLGATFCEFVRAEVDAIDPTDLGALNDFWALQRIQKQDEYEQHCDPDTKQYKEDQMEEKFNDYIRNWVDHIDPSDPEALKDIFFLQKIQNCEKYDELATPETHEYKEEQMGEKFNEWVRNAVDGLDPTDPDDLAEMVFLQKLQHSEKWDEYATPETEQYKEEQLKEKFNEWVRDRVDDLDPNDPNFQDELEKLRALQSIEKYAELATPETREYKERELSQKMGVYVTGLVNQLVGIYPTSISDFLRNLFELRTLQGTDMYQEFCSEGVNDYVEEQIAVTLYDPGDVTLHPNIVGTWPEDGQEDVFLDQPILIAFNQPMEPDVPQVEVWPEADYEFNWVEHNVILAMYPLTDTTYDEPRLIFEFGTGIMSASGMMLEEDYKFGFTTKGPEEAPHVVETLPLDGQTDASVGQPIEIAFDQPMEPASVEEAIVVSPAIDYAIFWQEDNTIAVLQPLASLEFNTTYTVDISTEAMSAEGETMEEEFGLSFITGIVPTPHVAGTMPLDGQTDIPSNYPIQIFFDWPMNPDSVEAALTVTPAIDYATEWLEGDFVLTIKPMTTLAAFMRYKIQLGAGATSADGAPMGVTFSISFVTGKR